MNGRSYLRKSILLCGEGDSGKFKRTFTITRKIGEGASMISYEAFYGRSGKGILKEFYPLDGDGKFYSLERNKDRQLVTTEGFVAAYENFQQAKKDYIEPYYMLMKAVREAEGSLNTFILPFEIYYGCDEDCNSIGTVYIWSPEKELKTFDKICEEIHKHPFSEPENKLYLVLNAIRSLADCICSLHSAELLHRDIKPSNFGFKERNGNILTQSLVVFDIDSICSVYNPPTDALGTDGFRAPEIGYGSPDNQTDIYSIGATLFYAIAASDEMKASGYLYNDEFYDRLKELVDTSKLIQASESNSHPRLRNKIVRILQKCLAPERNQRYSACEELLRDLDSAIYYLLPGKFITNMQPGERLVLVDDVEETSEQKSKKNSTQVFQHHLYTNPLYHWVPEGEENINILLIGFGNYASKFLDICLQVGQMRGKTLNVTIVSGDESDKEIYLQDRPELSGFFNIDGSMEGSGKESYGNIVFKTHRFSTTDVEGNRKIVEGELLDNHKSQYIFIALGSDELNLSMARVCAEARKALELNYSVNFVLEKQLPAEEKICDIIPVYVNEDITKSEVYAELERMAFNAHLVWQKNLDLDYKNVRAEFLKKYNHDSCVSNVLAIKYKLYSVGIDLDKCTTTEAAAAFMKNSLGADKTCREIKNELIWMEHRRWVIEKLCMGWTCKKNLAECMDGSTKDARKKQHVCILRSQPNQLLSMQYKNNNYEKWDSAEEKELEKLDELDRMSVELHRTFVKKAEEMRSKNLLYGSLLQNIKESLEGNKKVSAAFREWFVCLKDIWNKDFSRVKLYGALRDAFLKSLKELPESNRRFVKKQVESFEVMFYPILASVEYRDFKREDIKLIESIPFVLTYSEKIRLAIPFAVGDNDSIFGNVASATIINPSQITYMYYLEKEKELDMLKEAVSYVVNYMEKKALKANVEFVITHLNAMTADEKERIENEFKALSKNRIRKVCFFPVSTKKEISSVYTEYMNTKRRGRNILAVEKNETKLSYLLQGSDFHEAFDNYQFDSKSLKFYSVKNCEFFNYIKKEQYIRVTDMAAFKKSSSEGVNQPEFFADYKTLWDVYRKDSVVWKRTCDLLSEYAEKTDLIAAFGIKSKEKQSKKSEEYRYLLPFTCYQTVKKVIDCLIENQVADEGSCVHGFTTDSCEVIIKDSLACEKEYDRLFANVYALMSPDAIRMYKKNQKIQVVFDNLIVSRLNMKAYPSYADKREKICELLRWFDKRGYIIRLTIEDENISFTYATHQIKQLLTMAGRILEIYTYHKIKECGRFDDVVSGFEMDWSSTGVKSEFDCIVTKGFSALFIECKSRPVIEQDYYFKISCLAERFGINAKAVLIADTQEKNWYSSAEVNNMQRERGNMLNVVTVWKPEEINNIGHTLLKIVNEK